MKITNSSLDNRYTITLILYLHSHDSVPMGSLVPDVATNYRAVRDLVDQLEEEGIVKVDKQFSPRKKFTVELTEKGEKIADKLKEIEEILEGEG